MARPLCLQTLDPAGARLALKVERFFLDQLDAHGLPRPARLLLALSGGLDSTALAVLLHCCAPRLELELCAAHLDHGLRPESPADAEAVASLCAFLHISLRSSRTDVAAMADTRHLGLEQAGREARYDFLEAMRHESGAAFICTGHQLNDLAEDQLMRLARGAGWPGLAGMPAVDASRLLARPLLLTPRAALRVFLENHDIPWREDPSNSDEAFTRNRVRHSLLPLLSRENPNYLETAAGLWRLGRLDEDYWRDAVADTGLEVGGEAPFLSGKRLRASPRALRLRVLKSAVEAAGPGQALLEGLFRLDCAIMSKRTGAQVQFPGAKVAKVTRDGVVIVTEGKKR